MKKKVEKFSLFKLVLSIAICQLAGVVGSIFTISAIPTWYAALNKPSFSPPSWVFGPVWLTLYLLMGISLYLVWSIKKQNKEKARYIFGAQLFLNALWSLVFFGLKSPILGLVNIVALWFMILATIVMFYRISKTAAYLLIPYICWVTIATALNYGVWVLN
jgi:tryptophan-rich sensory protein